MNINTALEPTIAQGTTVISLEDYRDLPREVTTKNTVIMSEDEYLEAGIQRYAGADQQEIRHTLRVGDDNWVNIDNEAQLDFFDCEFGNFADAAAQRLGINMPSISIDDYLEANDNDLVWMDSQTGHLVVSQEELEKLIAANS